MNTQDIRWIQRFSNFNKAFSKLDEAVKRIKEQYENIEGIIIIEDEFLDDILKEAVIQRFEYTHELAWNVMKDYLSEEGNVNVFGSKDATREAFSAGLLSDGEIWMEMIKSRNMTSHTYNEATADEIFKNIIEKYHSAFLDFQQVMQSKWTKN